jgi:hypothetical protein
MNKPPLTTIVTHLLRGALFIVLFFAAISMIWLARGQPAGSNKSLSNSETLSNGLRSANGAKTTVRVHDTAERSQIVSPQQNRSATSAGPPSGAICGVESRAAHGQVAPNTNGGTLNPVAFINPTSMHPGASHLTRRSTARIGIKECSLQTQTVQSVQSLLAVAG